MSLEGNVAIVTGGSRGLGRAAVLQLAREGTSVVVGYHVDEKAAHAVVAEVEGGGGRAFAVQADVRREEDVARLVGAAEAKFERLDILVCCAGVVRDALAATMTIDDWDTVLDTNLKGTFLCVRACIPSMMARRSGSIVLLSSVAAELGGRGHANYAASKGGVNAFVRSMAVELAKKNIRVNGIAPGMIVTDMSERVRSVAEKEILAKIPMRRLGRPEEVAQAIRFLASDESSYVTGEILHVTGGMGV